MNNKNPILVIKDAGHSKTPPCPDAIFKRGDVVKVRDCRRLQHFPREAVVDGAIVRRGLLYIILIKEGDPNEYHASEKDLTPTGKTVEIGSIKREGAAA